MTEKGLSKPRSIPSKKDYHIHCAGYPNDGSLAKEILDNKYYKKYTLTDFYPRGLTEALGSNPYPKKKIWPKLLYTAQRRVFRASGIRAKAFPELIKNDLRRLSDLYDKEPKINPSA